MNNYTLHKLPKEGFIITSDEEIEKNDLIWYNNTLGKLIFAQDDLGQGYEIQIGEGVSYPIYDPLNIVRKVIAQQQQIDFSELTEEEQKEIEWLDLEKLAFEFEKLQGNSYNNEIDFFIGGFQKAQELLSDKRFTLEDMELFAAELIGRYRLGEINDVDDVQKIIASHSQSKSWKVELEMEQNMVCENIFDGNSVNKGWKTKITNSKIKIIRIL
jgi:hypothetical protein